jgi:hypothetical protein
MLTVIPGLPDFVVGIKATGEVNKEDMDTVLIPALDNLVNRTGEIYYLLVLETPVSEFTAGAWLKDAAVGLKHFTKWKKIAVVSSQEGVQKFTDAFSYLTPGVSKGFAPDQLAEAKAWVSIKGE